MDSGFWLAFAIGLAFWLVVAVLILKKKQNRRDFKNWFRTLKLEDLWVVGLVTLIVVAFLLFEKISEGLGCLPSVP